MGQIFAEKKRVKRVLVYLLVASRYGKGRQTPKKRRHFLTREFSPLMLRAVPYYSPGPGQVGHKILSVITSPFFYYS